MLRITEISSPSDLADLRGVWAELLSQTAGATFFHSLQWLETYWQFYGSAAETGQPPRLRVILVESGGKPIGILPLAVVTERYRVGHLRVLGYPLAGWGSFYGPIGPQPAETLSAGLDHINRTPRNWDVVDLRWVDPEIDRDATPQAILAAGLPFDAQVWHRSAQIELERGWDDYWQARKSTWRSNVRRCERLLARSGRLEYFRWRPEKPDSGDVDSRWDLYDTCVDLARRSWQGSSTSGTTLSHDSVRDYLRAAHATAANAGAVDLNLLLQGDRPVAFAYNYHYRGWVYGLRSGYDPAAVQDGAGTVLMAKMIEDSCRRGDRLLDLGPNYLDCKRYWLTRLHPAWHYTHFPATNMRAQALRLKRIVKRWLTGSQRPAKVCDGKAHARS